MKIVIYGKASCDFCKNAKKVCEIRGIDYEYKQLGVDYELPELQNKVPLLKTFPAVFVNGNWIGGYEDLIKMLR